MNIELMLTSIVHCIYGTLRRSAGLLDDPSQHDDGRDRGAVSLEQVLWFVAAGVAVAVIAAIVWGKIKNEANKPVNAPTAP